MLNRLLHGSKGKELSEGRGGLPGCCGYHPGNSERNRVMAMQESIGANVRQTDETRKDGQEDFDDRTRPFSPEYYQTVAFLAKSLADENRLRILRHISSGKKSVGSIVEELNLSQPLVSHHLKELKRSLLVRIERNGPFIYYELVDRRILDVIQTLSMVANDLLSARKTF